MTRDELHTRLADLTGHDATEDLVSWGRVLSIVGRLLAHDVIDGFEIAKWDRWSASGYWTCATWPDDEYVSHHHVDPFVSAAETVVAILEALPKDLRKAVLA